MTVFNFTNRKQIPRDGVHLSIGISELNGQKVFSFKCQVVDNWYQEYKDYLLDSNVSLRFKDKISGRPYLKRVTFQEFIGGVVTGHLDKINVADELPQCDINIIDSKGMILFKGKDWNIHDDRSNSLAKPSSLLPVRSVDLDGLLYKVDYSNDALGPVLLVNKSLHMKSRLVQPMFSGLIVVPVIEQVLTYAVFVDKQDLLNPNGWFEDWLKVFPFNCPEYDSTEGLENNTPVVLEWIEKVLHKFADSHGFVNKISLEEESGSPRN